jgi:hypothetical protein
VDKGPDCWLWRGPFYRNGYGIFRLNEPRRTALAHRVAYELERGTIPRGLVVDHLCRVKACVNPHHLEVVPQRTNVQRGEAGWNLRSGGKDAGTGNASRWRTHGHART